MNPDDSPAGRKLVRLSLACNQCRKRKVRCDAKQPKCRNCSLRGEECETLDLRRPGKGPGVRQRARRSKGPRDGSLPAEDSPGSFCGHLSTPAVPLALGHEMSPGGGRSRVTRGTHHSPSGLSSTSETQRIHAPDSGEEISWVSRGYREITAAQPVAEGQSEGHTVSVVSPDVLVNTDETTYRFKFLGASSVQCLFQFVDLHLAQLGYPPASSGFHHGMRHAEEFSLPLFTPASTPDFPEPSVCSAAVDSYFTRVWPLFPAVHKHAIDADIARFQGLHSMGHHNFQASLTAADIPVLAAIYAILCIGLDEISACPTEDSSRYLSACYSLLPHMLAVPYISSIQALILLALALRGRTKDGQASQIVGQAIRMAQSMGLHKHSAGQPAKPGADQNLHQRIWWSCHALEKLIQLESGRPSMTQGQDGEYSPPSSLQGSHDSESSDIPGEHFTAWVSLSNIMGQISDRLYLPKFTSSQQMLSEVARLDQILLDWQRSLSDHIRPGSHSGSAPETYMQPDDVEPATSIPTLFLCHQFYHAQLTLLRVALIFPQQGFAAELKLRKPDLPASHRLASASLICATAARELVTQVLQLADHGIRSTLLGATQVLLAAIVLSLGILRQPGRRLARADVELLRSATEYVEDHATRWGQDAGLVGLYAELRERVAGVVERRGRGGGEGDETRAAVRESVDVPGSGAAEDLNGYDAGVDLFGDMEFEQFWNMMDADFLLG